MVEQRTRTPEFVTHRLAVFSPEQRNRLESGRYSIFTLTGVSPVDLFNQGKLFSWDPGFYDYEHEKSMIGEVAIWKPAPLYSSRFKTFEEQKQHIHTLNKEFRSNFPGVRPIIGSYADYVELAFLHDNPYNLFELFGKAAYVRTMTTHDKSSGPEIGFGTDWQGRDCLWTYIRMSLKEKSEKHVVIPLIVPVETVPRVSTVDRLGDSGSGLPR